MGERRPRAALEEPTLFALTDKEPKYLGERLIDVDLADRILRLWSQVCPFQMLLRTAQPLRQCASRSGEGRRTAHAEA